MCVCVCGGGGGPEKLFSIINVFHRRLYDLPREAIEPKGSNCFTRVSVPIFLRKPIATFDFPDG